MPLRGSIKTLPQRAQVLGKQVAQLVLDEHAQRIVLAARGPWPVDLSPRADNVRSKEQLLWERVSPGGSKVGIRIINPATNKAGQRYATFILSKGVRPWPKYIVEPTLQMARSVGPEIARRITAALAVH